MAICKKGMNDKPLRRAPDKIKRETSHECDLRFAVAPQHFGIAGIHDSHISNFVIQRSILYEQFDRVANLNIFQDSKETVAMTRDSKIPNFAWLGRAGDSPDTTIKGQIIGAFENGNRELKLRNSQNCEWWIEMLSQTVFISLDPFFGPETNVESSIRATQGR